MIKAEFSNEGNMALTFRSTIAEYVQIIVRDTDGSKRVATLERDPNNSRKWIGSVDHPSGTRYSVDASGVDSTDALDKLSHAFVSREIDYQQSKNRGHRPEPKPFDYNVSIADDGSSPPPIVPNPGRR
jgi:hypothetical protein